VEQETAFDRLTRDLATPMPRCRALRLLAGGLAAVALGGTGWRVLAAATDVCPQRISRPGYVSAPTGCGAKALKAVPDRWDAASFAGACDRHDGCYDTCNRSKTACDDDFARDLQAACRLAYGDESAWDPTLGECLAVAGVYAAVVRGTAGDIAYAADQGNACVCCPPGQVACGDACCA
jgi:secretory phospholipase A2